MFAFRSCTITHRSACVGPSFMMDAPGGSALPEGFLRTERLFPKEHLLRKERLSPEERLFFFQKTDGTAFPGWAQLFPDGTAFPGMARLFSRMEQLFPP